MKKIDLHLHTVQTVSDKPFTYSFDSLERYVKQAELDAIAITNHNMFDQKQYEEISTRLEIAVFPGIEIDLEGCHLLLISDNSELSSFAAKCQEIESLIPDKNTYITFENFKSVFPDYQKYLLIPHYKKDPSISEETLKKLVGNVSAGEVTSPKKFIYCLKNSDSLVPVYFSDLRLAEGMKNIPTRQTFVDVGEITLSSLKHALKDKHKVYLSEEDGHKFFEALPNGLKLSTGLNVILGERSSGKSFTLDQLYSQNEEEKIKYIKQFSLLESDSEDDEKVFSTQLKTKHSLITQDHLEEFKAAVDSLSSINLDEIESSVGKYVDSLLSHAAESDKLDSFAKASLFRETRFTVDDLKTLRELIRSVEKLIENTEYEPIITRHITMKSLKLLILDLVREFTSKKEEQLKKIFVNDLVSNIQSELKLQTAAVSIHDIDMYHVMQCFMKVDKFNELVEKVKVPSQFFKKSIKGFSKVAERRVFSGASDLKNLSGRMLRFSDAYNKYSESGYEYLKELRNIAGLEESEYYKYFIKIDYKILNSHGYPVSGGERSEFRLLEEISDSQQYDMLLIDEPESSFDNTFLLRKVNNLIKEISQNMPVVVVTHNATVGASIRPDYLLYTKKIIKDGEVRYMIFTGYPSDKELVSLDGQKIKNHDVLLSCLEAGEIPYKDRGQGYEMLKN